MQRSQSMIVAACALAFASTGACTAAPKAKEASVQRGAKEVVAARPWPTSFAQRSVLTAREIHIVGPKGLIEHLVILQDLEHHDHKVTTVSDGLRIEERVKPEIVDEPIRAQLDNLVIAAEVCITALESVSADHVVIEASGDVYWRVLESGAERRAETLRLVGEDGP